MREKSNINKYLNIAIGLIVMIVFHFLPPFTGMTQSAMAVLGTFLGSLYLWITVGIDWPSLLCIASLAFIPEIGIDKALMNSFGNATFAFLLFTFMCTYALSQTNFIKRIALKFVTSSIAQKGPWLMAGAFFLAVMLVGLFISPTVLFFIMLPILEQIYEILGLKKGDRYASMLIMGLIFSTSISSGMTPIAHVFPVLAIGVYETLSGGTISYANYMGFAIPAGLVMFVLMMLMFRYVMKPELPDYKGISEKDFQGGEAINQRDAREKWILGIFAVVVILWVIPGLIKGALPGIAGFINQYGTAMPPLLGVIAMSIVHVNKKPLININEAMTKGVSWPSLILAASTLVLGFAMTNKDIGLTQFLTASIAPLAQNLAPMLVVLLFVAWASLQSNVSSHMVTAQLVSSLAVPVAASDGTINAAAIASVIGMLSTFGSATPPSMPYVAVSIASSWTDAKTVLKYGLIMMLLAILCGTLIAYPLAAALMR